VLSRPLALLILVMLPACADPHAPSDAPSCATEAECSKLYRDAVARVQACHRNVRTTDPSLVSQQECDHVTAEANGLATALERLHEKKKQEQGQGDEDGPVFEVPPAKSAAP